MTERPQVKNFTDFELDALYSNREISLLAFNRRVLEMAKDPSIPLLEQLRYLCISSNNLDEFFEVRVAGLKQQVDGGISTAGSDGLSPQQQLDVISESAHQLVKEQYQLFNDKVLPDLEEKGIEFLRRKQWSPQLNDWVKDYYVHKILPVLSPLALDPAHPFPRLTNKSLNFIIMLDGTDAFGRKIKYALLRAPRSLPRVIPVPKNVCERRHGFVFLSSIIHSQMASLFPGMTPVGAYQFRVTRNSDLYVSDEDVANLRGALEEELLSRNYGKEVRLEVADNCPDQTIRFLLKQFKLNESELYRVNGIVNLSRLFSMPDLIDRPELKYPSFTPHLAQNYKHANIFELISREKNIVLHHPYESYTPVVELVRQAAKDPKVLAIKQTLYRTGIESSFVRYLMDAARAGKDVTVIIELRARFDEEENIMLANKLQEVGIQVVYGVVGFKTHAKMLLVVRREKDKLVQYVHVGTGNYHTRTARLYTDVSLLTVDTDVTHDIQHVFMQLSGLGQTSAHQKILQAPFTLHKEILSRIAIEIKNAKSGKPAHIIARMNSLVEPKVIQMLYEASCCGVKIELIVRGICVLKPGIKGLSDNIRVISIIGRFLEHSRIYYFLNDDQPVTYLASADWMPRNFFARVEVATPLEGMQAQRIKSECLDAYLKDNVYSWELQSGGEYKRIEAGKEEPFSVQHWLRESVGTGDF